MLIKDLILHKNREAYPSHIEIKWPSLTIEQMEDKLPPFAKHFYDVDSFCTGYIHQNYVVLVLTLKKEGEKPKGWNRINSLIKEAYDSNNFYWSLANEDFAYSHKKVY